jgi:hypothetical protein
MTKNVTKQDSDQLEISEKYPNIAAHCWKPGQTGNPKGRGHVPMGFTAHLRRLLAKGFELNEARVLAAQKAGIDLTRVDPESTNAGAIAHVTLDLALRGDIAAIKEIADRTEGKPLQSHEIMGNENAPITVLSYDEAKALRKKLMSVDNPNPEKETENV